MVAGMAQVCVFAPAKINLTLAVTGRRADGFHELISLVGLLDWGDTLWLETRSAAGADTLVCDAPDVPTDAANLVLRAAAAFRRRAGADAPPPVRFDLRKEIPAGAGLGGGSSDAAAALRGLNQIAARPLSPVALRACAAETGSDVPLFLENRPVVMRGRGERVEALGEKAAAALPGGVLIFKPPFGVSTAWAYGRLKERGDAWYIPAAEAEARLAAWFAAPAWSNLPLENNLENPVFEKFAALPVLLEELRERFGLRCRMSGSGSACFALLEPGAPRAAIEQTIRAAWGPETFVRAGRLTGGA
jgi:4-diphosphocytidyl-2-C-methyl-D-erythritol kinase